MSEWKLLEGEETKFDVVYRMVNTLTGETREMYRTVVAGGFVYITASSNSRGARSESSFFMPAAVKGK